MRPRFLLASALAVASFAPVTGPFIGWMAGGSSAALAQGQLQGPAELPPASYRAMQYVDSRGCAFVRAGASGQAVWVPRVTRERQQVCGQPPSQSDGQVVAPTMAPAPLPVVTATAEPVQPAVQTPSQPPVLANVGAPIATIAGALQSTAAPPAAAPPVAPQPAPRALTLAEACQGRTGPLAGYVNAETGQAVSCGPAPVAIAMAPVAAAARSTPQTAALPPGAMTLADACNGKSGVLEGYVSADTGLAVECPASMPKVDPAISAANDAPLTAPAACPQGGACAGATLTMASNTAAGGLSAETARTRHGGSTDTPHNSHLIDPAGPAPTSNPVGLSSVASPPPGYMGAFDDGRLNARRGPQGGAVVGAVAHDAAQAQQVAVLDSTSATVVGAGHRFVQVGSYGENANADRAVASVRAMGLPVTISGSPGGLQSVAAGPFVDTHAAQAALRVLREAGFRDAYTR